MAAGEKREEWKKRGVGCSRGEEERVEEKGRRLWRQGRREMGGRKGA